MILAGHVITADSVTVFLIDEPKRKDICIDLSSSRFYQRYSTLKRMIARLLLRLMK